MIKVLIVDDSKTETALLKQIIDAQPDMEVIGCVDNGKKAVESVERLKPDLITMDIHMPIMNGLEATRLILSKYPVPIIVISSQLNDKELNATFEAFEAGALSVLAKPVDITSSISDESLKRIVETIRTMSVIKVIKRRFTIKKLQKQEPVVELSPYLPKNIELVAIGSSVGGPQALKTILSGLPADFPVPIVIVQHMTQGFINGFAHWLDNNVTLNVKSAENNEWLAPGTVYFAPDDAHMEVQRIQGKFMIYLAKGQPVSGFYPSITMLLKSVVKVCDKNAVGILLTGMGSDGAEGLLDLKKAGSHTLIQDAKSSVVFGMAGVAQSLGAVDKVVELDKLAGYLKLIVRSSIT